MDMNEFEGVIEKSIRNIPGKFREILENQEIKVLGREKVPEPVRKKFSNKIVFGIFIGVPYGRFTHMQTEPTRIELYKESFERVFNNSTKIKEQIVRTVIHEIAHYFGFNETDIKRSGF
jgi:predicted Zn-dependent protease with MMP-like domain